MGTLVRALAVANFGVVDGVGRENVMEPLLARLRREERMPRVRTVHILQDAHAPQFDTFSSPVVGGVSLVV
jgi:hypothetical protein